MTDRSIFLPPRRNPFTVRIEREGEAYAVICREHGWLFGDSSAALMSAFEIARGFDVQVEVRP